MRCGPWSPDGQWITYRSRESAGRPWRLFALRVSDPANPKEICAGPVRWDWADSVTLVVYTAAAKTFKYSVLKPQPERFFEDSTFAVPISGTPYVYYSDYRAGRQGDRVVRVDANGKAVDGRAGLTLPHRCLFRDHRVFLYEKKDGEIWRLTLPDCREEHVRQISGLPHFRWTATDSRGTKLAYVVQTTTMRLILYENLFE